MQENSKMIDHNFLVSICIPTYNGEKFLIECLDSALDQTYTNIEILIVDDCSSDRTVKITESYLQKDKRIKIYKNTKNLGLVNNWNKCLQLSKGEYIKFAFQDDILLSTCVEDLMLAVKGKKMAVCNREFIFENSVSDEKKNYYNQELLTLQKLFDPKSSAFISNKKISQFAAQHLSSNFIGEPTAVIFEKKLIDEVGYFNTNLNQICDLEYWLRISTVYGLVYVPKKLVKFRIHSESTTNHNLINNKSFADPIKLIHDFIYSPSFSKLRNFTGKFSQKKFEISLKAKLYEAYKSNNPNNHSKPEFLNVYFSNYPNLKIHFSDSIFTRILFKIILLKRKLS